ncbi:MAG: ferric reductase-like transmembrane domain-containing protein [Candidatus Micrarchaeota archaeon]|nr:ferric reductase-like transmembrane domain-containing protein [Candidatus Micrarchaeota archaeon]
MRKTSFLFLILILAIAIIIFYHSYTDLSPVTMVIRAFGLIAYLLLSISLMIGPLMRISPSIFAELYEPRRAIGIAAFVFGMLHAFLVLSSYFLFDVSKVYSQFSLLTGQIALFIMSILTLTSSDFAIKKLGVKTWQFIHSFNIFAFLLATHHFVFKSNGLMPIVSGKGQINYMELVLITIGFIVIVLRIYDFISVNLKKSNLKSNLTNNETKQGS